MSRLFLTETHLHTSEASACATASGAEQAEQYKKLGYDTIIVTDHFFNGNSAIDRSLPWETQVDLYCLGYENAKKRGDEIGLNVIFGIEYTWTGADFIIYGVDKDWLKSYPDTLSVSVQEFCDRVHASGGVVVHAHPFRERGYIHELKFIPDYTDAVEGYNAGNGSAVMDERAVWYAEQYGFLITAGSDCHSIGGDFHNPGVFYGIYTENEIKTAADIVDVIKERRISKLKL